MESPTQFDLETAIVQWRSQAAAESAIAAHAVAELEEHLRTGVDQLVATGLNSEEAFLIMTRRLGRTEALASEFHRADPGAVWKRRVFWMVLGWFAVGDWMTIQSGLLSSMAAAMRPNGSAILQSGYLAILIALLVSIIPVLVAVQLARGTLSGIANRVSSGVGTKRRLSGCVLAVSGVVTLFSFLLQRPSHDVHAPYSTGLWTDVLLFFCWGVTAHLPFALLLGWLMPARRGASEAAN